ncbi:hypothetical protein PsAD2_02670 [Pseudovibrio axinellae]|uniref:Glycoside hydrolase family 5 domain-containing protein n=1 Tax=Pseudovibrio axinellae TaxID=989403 RepID=A0A165XZU3_9HYPH|nr:hypothetical protein [Pseudovibrio axinellae]KZL18278.1 hypothetical protein PsAD2_02670 [Pseudovibrio axinellae]SER72890.1 hypothetical protein SAMN05421798_11845 [Pseudovibrio axinellae]
MAMTALERCKYFGVANIQGMAYHPGPSNYSKSVAPGTLYERSDFYNNIFTQLWSTLPNETGVQGRGDLLRFKQQLGVNFIHCYDWSEPVTQKDEHGNEIKLLEHDTFFKLCSELGMKVTLPISNYVMELLSKGEDISAADMVLNILNEVGHYPNPAVGMIKVFNEYELCYDRSPKHVVEVLEYIAGWDPHNPNDECHLPIMVCTSFGMKDGIEGAGYMRDVYDEMMRRKNLGPWTPQDFWRERMVFATNPQNLAADIKNYLEERLPAYWAKHNIPAPPVMFTELGSNMTQTGGEANQAKWMSEQIAASKPGSSGGNMLGACVFLNEERPWEDGPERTYGVMRFNPDTSWGRPATNSMANTKFPVWDNNGWWWGKSASYPVEQQAPKLNYASVAKAWAYAGKTLQDAE